MLKIQQNIIHVQVFILLYMVVRIIGLHILHLQAITPCNLMMFNFKLWNFHQTSRWRSLLLLPPRTYCCHIGSAYGLSITSCICFHLMKASFTCSSSSSNWITMEGAILVFCLEPNVCYYLDDKLIVLTYCWVTNN